MLLPPYPSVRAATRGTARGSDRRAGPVRGGDASGVRGDVHLVVVRPGRESAFPSSHRRATSAGGQVHAVLRDEGGGEGAGELVHVRLQRLQRDPSPAAAYTNVVPNIAVSTYVTS